MKDRVGQALNATVKSQNNGKCEESRTYFRHDPLPMTASCSRETLNNKKCSQCDSKLQLLFIA